eukprot:Skav218005  [mRNA]  locus=scaffold2344:105858:107279:- [translate_table: standard]
MDVTRPEIVRVMPVFRAFEQRFSALRDPTGGDLYFKSHSSNTISVFWSHSWHGSRWLKILTLITIYNGQPAIVLGMSFATVIMVLFWLQVLPGFNRGEWGPFSCWALCSGVVVTTLVMIFWRPRARVFLDRICISHSDAQLKAESVLSLAGLLRRSDSMLILWDPTWTQRLWCLFELAAFLRSRTDRKKLVIIPTLVGPVRIGAFLVAAATGIPITMWPVRNEINSVAGMAFLVLLAGVAVGYVLTSTLRSYFRDLDTMKEQLFSISFDTAMCACCTTDHVDESGRPLMCDRLLVKECVGIWFDGLEEFERIVRSDILEVLVSNLEEQVMTTKSTIAVCIPFMWSLMDLASSNFNIPGPIWGRSGAGHLLDGLIIWLVMTVVYKNWLLLVCKLTRAKPRSWCLEFLKNSLVVWSVGLQAAIVMTLYVLTMEFPTPLGLPIFFLVSTPIYVCFAWGLGRVIKTLCERNETRRGL